MSSSGLVFEKLKDINRAHTAILLVEQNARMALRVCDFGYVLELEMLQEAGFHPLEVFQAATMNGAATLSEWRKQPVEFGVVKAGKLADLVLVDQNPLHNLKVLYGNGAVKLNDETEQVERVGGVRWTIKDGIVYDAKKLLADTAAMVEKQKAERKK